MDILELEKKYSELLNFLNEPSSNRSKLLGIFEFFKLVLASKNINLVEVYLTDIISKYLLLINSIKIRGMNFETISAIINQLDNLRVLDFLKPYKQELEESFKFLQKKNDLLNSWLSGNLVQHPKSLIYFPVIEKSELNNEIVFLEIIRVGVTEGENKFNIDPPESENDEQLQKQLHLCWLNAIDYCKRYVRKIKPEHTVELKFENRYGIYVGNSLGIALTLAFIEAILKHYNSSTIVNINGCIAVTGGIDNKSDIISTGKTIINLKTEAVFYSDAQIFCVPKIDEIWAIEKLLQLKKKYPNRSLKIVRLNDLNDLLDRRQIVDIRKQKIIVRSGKLVKKNWISAVVVVVLAFLISFLYLLDWDNNPVQFEQVGKILNVKNKNGRNLWTVKLNFGQISGEDRTSISRKFVDIDGDGDNEVIICEEDFPISSENFGRIVCFNKDKKIIWQYIFADTVSTYRKWSSTYQVSIIDTTTINQTKILLLMSRNIPNFPSAVFKLDLKTGSRVDSLNTLWNAGTITNGLVGDFNNDGEKEIILGGIHNGFQRAIIFSINLSMLGGQTPAPDRYEFKNITKSCLNEFILLPFTDFGRLFNRANAIINEDLFFNKNSEDFRFATLENADERVKFHYAFDKYLNFKWVDCGDDAQIKRDSLVIKGILNQPYTNTNEYFEILRKQIEYWDGEKFVNIDVRAK